MEFLNPSPLFSNPSFLKGIARSVDLTGTLTRYKSDKNADYKAMKRDWSIVGKFIYSAIVDYGKSSKNKNRKG